MLWHVLPYLFIVQAFAAKFSAEVHASLYRHEAAPAAPAVPDILPISEGLEADRHPFEGIGALSAGASSRLLQDYPETQRDEILDLLFKPRYGASLQVLKVEIGGDTQSTDGSEPSHMRYRGEPPDCSRGYEAWLLQEAKARNPSIRTFGLAWGAPGWIGNGTFFSEDNIDYHVSWLRCIKERYAVDIDYLGIWNEMKWGNEWYVFNLAAAIKEAKMSTQLVLLDQVSGAADPSFLESFTADERFQELVAAVGYHYPCSADEKLVDALAAHPATRFWSSEELSTVADWGGAGCWGRVINQNYVRMNTTSSIAWSLIWSVYPNLECFGNGLLYAFEPWTGHYEVMSPLWTSAHTTQFTEIGWTYLPVGSAAGLLPEGGTYVTIASPSMEDFSMVFETLTGRCMYHDGCFHSKQPTALQNLRIQLSGTLAAAARSRGLEVWATNASHWFQRLDDLSVDDRGVLRISMAVDSILTVSTLHTATKQGERDGKVKEAEIPEAKAFPIPFQQAFDDVDVHRSAPFFADQGGTFEVVEDAGSVVNSRLNRVLEQQVVEPPIGWAGAVVEPFTLFGDTNWTDVSVEALVRFQGESGGKYAPLSPFGHAVKLSLLETSHASQGQQVSLCARVLRFQFFGNGGKQPEGYCLKVQDDPRLSAPVWVLYASSESVAAGALSEEATAKIRGKGWLQLRLEVYKARIVAYVDATQVASILDTSLPVGQVGLGCGYHKCQFDNVKVLPRAPNVTSLLLTPRPLLSQYSPVTFHYAARSCDASPTPARKRADYTGFVGLAFEAKVPLKMVALGLMIVRGGPALSAVHNVELLELDNTTGLHYLASAAVPTMTTQQVGIISTDEGFQYAELREPILLTPGRSYVLASSEMSGGDFFFDKAVVAEPSEGVAILGPAYSNEQGWVFDPEPNNVFGPLNALLLPSEEAAPRPLEAVKEEEPLQTSTTSTTSTKISTTSTTRRLQEAAPEAELHEWVVQVVEDETLNEHDLSE